MNKNRWALAPIYLIFGAKAHLFLAFIPRVLGVSENIKCQSRTRHFLLKQWLFSGMGLLGGKAHHPFFAMPGIQTEDIYPRLSERAKAIWFLADT